MEKNRDGAGVAANRIIKQIDALKVVASIFLSKSCMAFSFLLDSWNCISAGQRDDELRATHHSDSYRSCNNK
jgi:hypothetical protein